MNEVVTIKSAFSGDQNAIVFAADDYYCPYLSVMLYYVVEHISSNRLRDITIQMRQHLRS